MPTDHQLEKMSIDQRNDLLDAIEADLDHAIADHEARLEAHRPDWA